MSLQWLSLLFSTSLFLLVFIKKKGVELSLLSAPLRSGGAFSQSVKVRISLQKFESLISPGVEFNNIPISMTSILKGSEVVFPSSLEATTVTQYSTQMDVWPLSKKQEFLPAEW